MPPVACSPRRTPRRIAPPDGLRIAVADAREDHDEGVDIFVLGGLLYRRFVRRDARETPRGRRGPAPRATSPRASHASAQIVRTPPELLMMATRLPARQRLVREQNRHVEHLLERVGANHAGLLEQRLDVDLALDEIRAGAVDADVGARRRRRPARLRALLTQRTGLRQEIRRATRANRRGFTEGLQIQQGDVGRRILLPELQEIVAGDVGAVPRRHEASRSRGPARPRSSGSRAREPPNAKRTRCARAAASRARDSR